MKRRIGILTSGGDCPGLNACIRGVARASYSMFDTEIVGIQDGYAGLIAGDYKEMKQSDFSGILTLGGTILGTSRDTLLYNGAYMLPELIFTVVGAAILFKIPQIKKLIVSEN